MSACFRLSFVEVGWGLAVPVKAALPGPPSGAGLGNPFEMMRGDDGNAPGRKDLLNMRAHLADD